MNKRRLLAMGLTVALLAGILAGCGAAPMDNGYVSDGKYEMAEDAVAEPESSVSNSLTSAGGSTESVTPQNQKLIRTLYLNAETEDMDALLSQVEQRIAELGGYVEAREIYNGSMYNSRRYRNASLTIRIPADKLDAFVSHVSEVSNITSNRETTEDVTLRYVATQSRITALETEQTRLLELLAKAETMDDLLMIESRLTEVRTELEQVTSQLRLYDNLVDYGTIHLDLEEVVEYTEPEPETVWERMGSGFMESLKGLGDGLTELVIFIVASLPYLALLAAITVVIILLIKRARKKRKLKKAQQFQQPPQNNQ